MFKLIDTYGTVLHMLLFSMHGGAGKWTSMLAIGTVMLISAVFQMEILVTCI